MRPVSPSGVPEIDRLLEGGLPVGAISEFTGPVCSGRVSLALAFAAGQIRAGQVCAWVDAADGLDPASAEASGVDLQRLLWVRCGQDAEEHTDPAGPGSRFAVHPAAPTTKGHLGMHPRSEERGLAAAIGAMLKVQNGGRPGTPSAANIPLSSGSSCSSVNRVRVEQIATDRLPARRGEHALEQKSRLAAGENGVVPPHNQAPSSLTFYADEFARTAPRCTETQGGFSRSRQAGVSALPGVPDLRRRPGAPGKTTWDRLDQAIRATDLLLSGGGFGAIVMDLSGVAAEFANRIPLATWFRFRAAADRARTVLLVLSRHACTGSSGEVLLRMTAGVPEGTAVMGRVPLHVELARQRFAGNGEPEVPAPASFSRVGNVVAMRKPPARVTAADWVAPCASLKAAGVVR